MSHPRRRLATVAFCAAALVAVAGQPANAVPTRAPTQASTQLAAATVSPEVSAAARHDTSTKLTEIAAAWAAAEKAGGDARIRQAADEDIEQRQGTLPRNTADPDAKTGSSAVQATDVGTAAFPEFPVNFEGVGNLDGVLPPDTNGDVGPNHYVQMINIHFAVYDKTGNLLLGPLPNNALWDGFGGPCETENDGDPVVLYDEAADRWMMSQFALPGGAAGFHQCMAVSQTGDPTGAWHRYDFLYHQTRINDYPKYGIWPDAYYMTTNEFAPSFVGAGAVAFEREKMLAGQNARQVYFHLGPEYGGLLPSDAEGLAPPAGAPNPFVMFDDDAWGISPTDRLMVWDFTVNWADPAASTFGVNGVPNRFLETAPFDSNMCNYARSCVPQQGTAQRLDAISDRLMYRAAYRNFGGHASIVLNHTVDVDGADHAGIRWYELHSTAGNGWTIHQQGTYAPDAEHRWMGSAAIDVNGNIAIGYSASSGTSFPSIRVAGRLAGDPLGQLPQAERTLIAGTGAQTHSAARWGDYSSMSVDPTDGCTFWFTTEYLTTTSSADWKTRVGAAKFPSCQAGPSGVVTGTVTDAGTGDPIAGATVSTGASSTVTGGDGRYSFTLPVGDHELSASAYGYLTQTAQVTITDGGTVTKNFALAVAPRATVRGKVTDGSGHGWPLYARIDIAGRPGGPVFSDPASGEYVVEVAAGATYQVSARAMYPGYQPVEFALDVGADDLTRDIAVPVDAAACLAAGYTINYSAPMISEPFDGTTTPAGWSVVNRTTSGGWSFNDPGGRGNLTGGDGGFAIADSDDTGPGITIDTDLVAPALDLSAAATPYVRFNSDYRGFSNGFADVDVSTDGGTTWTTLSHWTTTSRRGPVVEQIPLTGAGGAADVRVRFHYRGTWAWWWEVDDVEVVNRTCDPVPGGLLVGVTTDANTGIGLNGTTVTSGDVPAESTVSAPTPDDPAISDGFYWLFSSVTGTHPFTAAKPPYLPARASVNLAADGTIRQDFALAAGRLSVTPGEISTVQPYDSTRTATVTITNTGGAPASVELLERSGDFEMLGLVGAKLSMRRVKGGISKAMTGSGGGETGAPAPAVDDAWTSISDYPVSVYDNGAAAFDGKVYSVGGGSGTGNERRAYVYDPLTDAWTALPEMPTARAKPQAAFVGGKLYVLGGWGAGGVPVAAVDVFDPAAGSWSTVSGATNPKPRAAAGVGVADGRIYLVGGCVDGSCNDSSDTIAFDPATGAFTELAGYPQPSSWMSCGGIAGRVYCAGGVGASAHRNGFGYDPTADTWTAIADMPLDLWGSQYASASGLLVVAGGVTAASTTITNRTVAYDPANNTWLDLPNAQHLRYRGAGACGAYKVGGSPSSFVGSPDSERLGGLEQCDEAADVPWLAGAPGAFTLAPGASQTVTVTLSATPAAGVDQPGAYRAEFGVRSDTPYPVPAIGVEMNVSPPKTWGKLTGTVLGQSCAGDTAPLAATVRVNAAHKPGNSITLRSDNQGRYAYWLPAGRYEVVVAKDGWIPDAQDSRITAGKTLTLDFTLNPSVQCSGGPVG